MATMTPLRRRTSEDMAIRNLSQAILSRGKPPPMQNLLPAGGLRLYRQEVEPSGSLLKISGYIAFLLSRISHDARMVYAKRPFA